VNEMMNICVGIAAIVAIVSCFYFSYESGFDKVVFWPYYSWAQKTQWFIVVIFSFLFTLGLCVISLLIGRRKGREYVKGHNIRVMRIGSVFMCFREPEENNDITKGGE
jgi:hypothetical protein